MGEIVTDLDREAAANVVASYRDQKNGNWQQRIRDGLCDEGEMVRAFARHRLAASTGAQGAYPEDAMNEWLPISDAPRDGTQVIVPVTRDHIAVVSYWEGGWREGLNGLRLSSEPSVFMYAPTMPDQCKRTAPVAPRTGEAAAATLVAGEPIPLAKALKWYEAMVADCRKITPVGEVARQALDTDGGKLATSALAATLTKEARQYEVGPLTFDRVFAEAKLTNMSDMQAVLDAVEAALATPAASA